MVGGALFRRPLALWFNGLLRWATGRAPPSPGLVLLWIFGACGRAAAWQAKLPPMAALMLAGRAGLTTCITFVWFSAPGSGADAD